MPNYNLKFHLLAREEVSDAYHYYENQKSGLGDEFLLALDEVFVLIVENPKLFQKDFDKVRKALLKKFPFSIYYEVFEKRVFVYSIFHQSRNPEDWQKRVH
jgi:plasmid stabilization system protein ParE